MSTGQFTERDAFNAFIDRDHCEQYGRLSAAGNTLGTAREDLGEGIKIFTHQRWVIAFRLLDSGIEVLRIFDGRRDFGNLFLNTDTAKSFYYKSKLNVRSR